MNRIYSVVWNHSLHVVQVASELARVHAGAAVGGRSSAPCLRPLALACAAAFAMAGWASPAWPASAPCAASTRVAATAAAADDASCKLAGSGLPAQRVAEHASRVVPLVDPVFNIWAPSGAAAPGGTGTWSTTSATWTDARGDAPQAMAPQPGLAIFAGTAGTVTVDDGAGGAAPVSATGLQFEVDGYLLTGDALTLVADTATGNAPSISVGAADTATIDNALAGTDGLHKTGAGTLILTGDNTFTGGTTIEQGTLQLGAGGDSGSLAGDVVDNGALVFDRSNPYTFARSISGTGSVAQQGAGTLTFTGSSTGLAWTVSGGGLTVGDGTANAGLAGGTGLAATLTATANTQVSLLRSASVTGGYADDTAGGAGGSAVEATDATLGNAGTIFGGPGANFNSTAGTTPPGAGGAGVVLNGAAMLDNASSGMVLGGFGGAGVAGVVDAAGNGGAGSDGARGGAGVTAVPGVALNNYGSVQGGLGGTGALGAIGMPGTPAASGSNGGNGGNGGAGGAGGIGLQGDGFTLLNRPYSDQNGMVFGSISGGRGGNGGSGSAGGAGGYANGGGAGGNGGNGGSGGAGGAGGAAIVGSGFTVNNYASITGGYGGAAGAGALGGAAGTGAPAGVQGAAGSAGTAGAGGVGIVAEGNATILNAYLIAGGVAGDGQTVADAVDLSGGGNSLTLITDGAQGGGGFEGNVISTSGTVNGGDTFALGGTTNANISRVGGTFDLSRITTVLPVAYTGTTQFYGFNHFAKTGLSTWTVTGTTADTTAWNIQAGTLVLGTSATSTASLGGDATVERDATLAGFGGLAGTLDVKGGGILAPGTQDALGTLTVGGNLTLEQGSQLSVDLGAPGADATTPGQSSHVSVAGNLTLGGATLNATSLGVSGPGLYNIISYGGTCTGCADAGLVVGVTPSGQGLAVQYVAGQVNVLDSTIANPLDIWAPNGVASLGGSGTWSLASPVWTDTDNTPPAPMNPRPGFAIFQGTPGTVTVDDGVNGASPVSATGMQFAVDGYALRGDPLLLAGTNSNGAVDAPVVRVGDGTAAGSNMTATIANVLTGTAGLTKDDLGTLVLGGANTFTGFASVNGGTLELAPGAAMATWGIVVDDSAQQASTLRVDPGVSLMKPASGGPPSQFFVLAAAGGVVDNAGSIEAGSGSAAAAMSRGNIINHLGGTITAPLAGVSLDGTLTNDGVGSTITGTGGNGGPNGSFVGVGVAASGAGASVTNTGGARISGVTVGVMMTDGGSITNGAGSTIATTGTQGGDCGFGAGGTNCAIVSSPGQYASGGALTFANAGSVMGNVQMDSTAVNATTLTAGGVIQGNLDMGRNAASTLTLDGDAGTAALYADAVTGTTTFAGALTKSGAGTWTINGNPLASATGTTVDGGTLVAGDAGHASTTTLSGAATVANGATLAGFGGIAGDVTVQNGGTLAPGSATALGTLSIGGNLTLAQGGVLDVGLGTPGGDASTPGQSDKVNVAGDLTLAGAIVNTTNLNGFGQGLYNIIQYGGTCTGCDAGGLVAGMAPAGQGVAVQYATGQVNLLESSPTLAIWAPDAVPALGGSGTWSVTSPTWADPGNAVRGAMSPQPGFALFQGTPGTVTVDDGAGSVAATGLQFAVDGYTLAGDALSLVATAVNGVTRAPVIRVGDGTAGSAAMTATVNAVLAGTDGLDKKDFGTLVLAGDNTYTGGTAIDQGTLQLGAGGDTGSIKGDVTVNNGATLAFDHRNDVAFAGAIDGNGTVLQQGEGTLTYTGSSAGPDWLLAHGNLTLGDGTTPGSISGHAGGGTILTTTGGAVSIAAGFTVSGVDGADGVQSNFSSLAGGAGGLGSNHGFTDGSANDGGAGASGTVGSQTGGGGVDGSGGGTDGTGGTGVYVASGGTNSGVTGTGGGGAGGGLSDLGVGGGGAGSVAGVTGNGKALGSGGGGGGGVGAYLGTNADNGGVITGGAGGAGSGESGAGGGGVGVLLVAQARLQNRGAVTGGSGGDTNGGGGGGGGAGVVQQAATTVINTGVITGGVGGHGAGNGVGGAGVTGNGFALGNYESAVIAGGSGGRGAYFESDRPGTGGAGGAGVWGTGFTVVNTAAIHGGAGGNGNPGYLGAGDGGVGGAGVLGSGFTLSNSGVIMGGNGGQGAAASMGTQPGVAGAGAVGVIASGGSSITTRGRIAGGLSGDGAVQADAVQFSGGDNTLTLENGYAFAGKVVSTSGTADGGDTLALGGDSAADGGTGDGVFNLWLIHGSPTPADFTGGPDAAGVFQGFNRYTKTGTSTWTLEGTGQLGADDFIDWTVADGTLAGDATAFQGNIAFAPATSSATPGVAFNQGSGNPNSTPDAAFAGVISGAGDVVKLGDGTLILTGANTWSGGTTVSAGTLQVGDGGTRGALGTGAIIDNGTLAFDRSNAIDIGGTIGGNGTLQQIGSGTLTLDGNSGAFAGATAVQAGTLIVGSAAGNGAALGGDVAVDAGATLGGHGEIGGNVSVAGGAHVAPGNSIGTLTIDGNAKFAGGSVLDYEFGSPAAAPDAMTQFGQGDSMTVGGTLSLAGATLNVSDAGGMGAGLYNVFRYGALATAGCSEDAAGGSGGCIVLGNTPQGAQLILQYLTAAGQINLVDVTGATLDVWNANGQANATRMGGGDGTWSATSPEWTDVSGSIPNAAMSPQPGFAIFGGTPGTVSVDDSAGSVVATGMQFAVDGYTLAGDTLTLAGSNGAAPVIRVGDGTAASTGDGATIDNVLAGTDGLAKTDFGTLVLAGANTFSGGVALNGGTLSVANDGNLGVASNALTFNGGTLANTAAFSTARTLTLAGDGTLDTRANFTTTGAITGAGSFTKTGAGALIVNGDGSAFTGTTRITSGALVVGDDGHANASLGGMVSIASGAMLSGIGTLGGLDLAGTLSPGGSIGTLHVTGDATFAKGSIFNVEASPDGKADQLAVGGKVTINGGSVVAIAEAGDWLPRTTYTIVSAGQGISGSFDGVSDNLAFLTPGLGYSAHAVSLVLERNDVDFAGVALTPNEKGAATGANAIGWGNAVYDAVVKLDAPSARHAFDAISGEYHASQQAARIDDSRFVREAMNQRLRHGDADAHAAKLGDSNVTAWAHAWGHWGTLDSDGNAGKLADNGNGLLIGADLPLGAQGRIGITGGASRNSLSVRERASWGKLTSQWLGAFGGYDAGAFGLRGGIAYAWDQVPSNREVAFPGYTDRLSGNAAGDTLTGFVEGAWTFHLGHGRVSPFLNLAHARVETDASTEAGGAAALHAYAGRANVSFSTLGARGAVALAGHLDLHGELGWQHAFGDTTPQRDLQFASGSPVFTEYSVPIAKNAGVGRVGLGWRRGGIMVSADYEGLAGGGARDQAARLSVSVTF